MDPACWLWKKGSRLSKPSAWGNFSVSPTWNTRPTTGYHLCCSFLQRRCNLCRCFRFRLRCGEKKHEWTIDCQGITYIQVWNIVKQINIGKSPEKRACSRKNLQGCFRYIRLWFGLVGFADRKLAKSTLILIPLFAVYYMGFIWLPDGISPASDLFKIYVEMLFNSFQGFLVALLFCFLNAEVCTVGSVSRLSVLLPQCRGLYCRLCLSSVCPASSMRRSVL